MWIDDGSGCIKCEPDSPEFCVEGKPNGDSPVNARWSACLASGQYFEVDILEHAQSTFLGVATEEGFAQGYKCKGLFFGRNLSDGGGLVREGFGENFSKGMKIGVLTEFEGETIKLTFYQDGRCLGPGFASKRKTDRPVYPVVKAGHDGNRYAIRFPESAPAERTRQPKGGGAAHPAEGTWLLKRLNVGPELGEFPLAEKMQGEGVALKIEAVAPSTFHFSGRVVNRLNTKGKSEPDESLAPFDKLTTQPVACTMMMGPEGMMETEAAVAEALGSLHKWKASDGELLLVGPTAEMFFVSKADDPDRLPATEVELP